MIIHPIIPIPIMIIISIILIVLIIFTSKRLQMIIRILIVIVLFIVNLRFMVPNGNVEVIHNNLDVIFVVDTSLSMHVLDYKNDTPRLEAAKEDMQYIISKIPGARYSIITFDNTSEIKIPLTVDYSMTSSYMKALRTIDYLYANGSSIRIFKDNLERILNSSLKKSDRYRVVFLITDGEDSEDGNSISLSSLKQNINNGAVLGYGTKEGKSVTYTDYYGKEQELHYYDGKHYTTAHSSLDENNLKNISNELGIDYIYMNNKENIDKKIKEINSSSFKDEGNIEEDYSDLYYFMTPLLMILFLIELYIDRRTRL